MIPIQHLADPPEMTADLSAGAWSKLTWHERLTPPGRPGDQPTPGTAFAMAHDGDSLYVAVACSAAAGETQEELARENVQIQLDPECRGHRAGIFVCYTDGKASAVNQIDAKEAWPGEIECVARLQSGEWSMVLQVPLSQLIHADSGLRQIHFNVARVFGHAGDAGWLCYPTMEQSQFWMPWNAIGEAEFERPDLLESFVWAVQRAGRGRIGQNSTDQKNGETVCRQGVLSTNFSATDRDVDLRVELVQVGQPPSTRTERRLSVGAGESRREHIELPLPAGFRYGYVHVSLHEPDTGRCVSENRILVESEPLSWKEHFVKRGDGQGGYTCLPAQQQPMPHHEGYRIIPYGLATMDNGEVICAAYAEPLVAGQSAQTLIAVSGDCGDTWSEYHVLPGIHMRPMMLAYLGDGVVTFESGDTSKRPTRLFSHDYGRTWDERVEVPLAPNGLSLGFEGHPLVERDEQGNAIHLVQTGQTVEGAAPDWKIHEYIRWSEDGGRSWPRVDAPQAWRSTETHDGKTYDLCCGEGSLVRAANGWLVVALRTWVPVQYHDHPHFEDQLEGTAVSISQDDGDSWSPLRTVFEGGRHHHSLLRMPGGELVMTVIRRVDFRDGKLVSYRRGCDAVISRDHGETWDIEHMIVLDDFLFCDGENWNRGACGHSCSTLLPDGSILSGYCSTFAGGVLIRWNL